MIKIELPFVQPFKSARRKGKHYYDPLAGEKDTAKWIVRSQYSGGQLIGPICAAIEFEIGVAVTLSKKKRKRLVDEIWCLKKIDCDNLAKFCLDVIKGILIEDDSQIVDLRLRKTWAYEPRTVIYLWQSAKE